MAGGDTGDCFVCRKHRDRGPLVPGSQVAEDELVLVSHIITPGALGREGATAWLRASARRAAAARTGPG